MKKRILLILLLAPILSWTLPAQSGTIHRAITVQQADSLIKAMVDSTGFIILDVRTELDYENGHLEQAINMNYYADEFDQNLNLLNKNKSYLVYCAGGGRSTSTYNKMISLGFPRVYNMLGGINAWIGAGYPVVKGGGTGIWDFFTQHARVNFFPNPVTPQSIFEFQSSESQTCQIVLINLQGKTIKEFVLKNSEPQALDPNQLAPGLYFYRAIINGKTFKTGKIVCR